MQQYSSRPLSSMSKKSGFEMKPKSIVGSSKASSKNNESIRSKITEYKRKKIMEMIARMDE